MNDPERKIRVLFLPLITRGPALGTISRCLAVADHLRRFGHEVFFLTNGEGAKYVAEAGLEFMEGVVPDHPGAFHPLCDLSDVAVYLNLTREQFVRASLEAEQRAIDQFKPDVLFAEFKLTASISAATNRLPLISTACSPADPRFVSSLFSGERTLDHGEAVAGFNRVLEERGQTPISDVAELFFTRSDVKIAPTIAAIEPLLADVPALHYVGHLLYDRLELAPLPHGLMERADGKHVVFCYFGSGEIGPKQYVKVLPEAFDGSEFHAIIAVGDHPEVPRLPDPTPNTSWVRSVPGRSLLQCSRVLIFHGGQNTAMASLIHKVPSMVFPGEDFERDFNARGLSRLGSSILCTLEDFTPSKVLQLSRELLAPSYSLAAEKYGVNILKSGGPRFAADLVLKASRGN
jgi:UDP:flavonoid glycosyltransferase YjiC (YdhE family)